MKQYTLGYAARRRLHDRAYRAQQRDLFEVCGVLMTDKRGHSSLHFVKNHSKIPGHNEMYWSQVNEVRRNSPNLEFVGLFHSHPISEAVPGKGDLHGTPSRRLLLLYDVCGREVKLWRVVRNGRGRKGLEVKLHLEPRPANGYIERAPLGVSLWLMKLQLTTEGMPYGKDQVCRN